ncbi:hypothetical protein BV25DRAFT_1825153 [Artomyces pyxidatus]|uniref:Uncharacterized protein n=1 Tax=Artomyces pyxidatus TaxID=48021 RepID=A0ACB8T3U6_9AGAM|nr:hypothetical protein BV25DRAFT_1825153 [Artomyces pyxidatus]
MEEAEGRLKCAHAMDVTHDSPQLAATTRTGRELEPAAYRTPIEIYQEIFSYIPLLVPDSLMLHFSTAVSQVCRHWRRLALEMKELWTFIVVDPRNYTQRVRLALERSHPLPIVLHIEVIASDKDEYRKIVLHALGHISRARDLFINGAGLHEYEEFLDEVTAVLESHPAPLLESFQASYFTDLPEASLFLGQVPPKLRTVRMFACYTHSLLLRAPLTHLYLSEMEMVDILDLLDKLPSLEVMKLEAPALAEIDTFLPPPVALPNLQSLELAGRSVDSIVRFMGFLDVPCDADLSLRVFGGDLIESTFNTAMESMAAVYAGQIGDALEAGLVFRDLTIGPSKPWGDDNTLTLHNPTSVQATENEDDDPPSLPSSMILSMTWSHQFGDERRMIPRILSFMPATDSYETLNVTGKRLRLLQDWVDIALHDPKVSRIIANGIAAHGVVMALNQTDIPVFPRLDTLCITDLTLEDQVDERPAGPDYYPYMRIQLDDGGSLPFLQTTYHSLSCCRERFAPGPPLAIRYRICPFKPAICRRI